MLPVAVFVCAAWIVSVCLHEFGHAVVAYWGGDTSVKDKGYLTLNPLKYTDPGLSLILPIIFLLMGGIALPGAAVYVDHRRLRNRTWKSAVSAGGPAASILVTLLLTIPFWLGWATSESWLWPALAFLIFLQIFVVLLNLLPIPPLDGYGIIEPWLPQQMQIRLRKFGGAGVILLFMLLWFVEPLNQFFSETALLIGKRLGVPLIMVVRGYSLFNSWSSGLLIAAVALILLVRRLRRKPHEVWYDRANVHMRAQRYEKAIAAYDQAIQKQPDFYQAWWSRAWALNHLQRYEEALAAYEEALKIQPDDPAIWTDKGVVLAYLQRYEKAIAACDKAIQLNPEYPYAWYNKASCYAEQGHANLSIENLQRAINLDPYTFTNLAKTDSSFDLIRENELFKKLIGQS